MNKKFKFAVLAALVAASVTASAGIIQNGAGTLKLDPFGPNVVKIQRLTGTNDSVINFNDGSQATLANSWSQYFSGNAKLFHSADGVQNGQVSAAAGLDAGYNAVAVPKNNILFQDTDFGLKCVTYHLPATNTVKLCTTGYVDGIDSRTSPY